MHKDNMIENAEGVEEAEENGIHPLEAPMGVLCLDFLEHKKLRDPLHQFKYTISVGFRSYDISLTTISLPLKFVDLSYDLWRTAGYLFHRTIAKMEKEGLTYVDDIYALPVGSNLIRFIFTTKVSVIKEEGEVEETVLAQNYLH